MSNEKNISEKYVINAIPTSEAEVIPTQEAEAIPTLESLKTNYIDNNVYLQEVLIDEYVYVEEKYCGPISSCIGTILAIIFWPASLFVGCCLCDKRVVKKKVVRR